MYFNLTLICHQMKTSMKAKSFYSHEANTITKLIFPNHFVLRQINDNEP